MTNKPQVRIALAATLFILVLAPAALAGKPGGGGHTGGTGSTGSISLAPLVYDANGNGLPNWKDVVTFNASTTATANPYVNLMCYQNGTLVLSSTLGYFPTALNTTYDFTLNSSWWTGGPAQCTAYLDMWTKQGWKHLASTSFPVAG